MPTPTRLKNALKALRADHNGRLVALFGCGGDRDRTKRPIMGAIAADNADFVIVTSDNPRTEQPQSILDEILVGLEGKKTSSTLPYVMTVPRQLNGRLTTIGQMM